MTFFFNWDCLNRLTAHGRAGAWSANYGYRADGMRTSNLYNGVTTRYRHDGQMAIEDVETPTSGASTITRYGLGARGVDFMEQTVGTTVTKGFPIYDAHGNNVATLYRTGSGYSVQNFRRYSAWGSVRGGGPDGQMCAAVLIATDAEERVGEKEMRVLAIVATLIAFAAFALSGKRLLAKGAGIPIVQPMLLGAVITLASGLERERSFPSASSLYSLYMASVAFSGFAIISIFLNLKYPGLNRRR